jgi:hypothetical protein
LRGWLGALGVGVLAGPALLSSSKLGGHFNLLFAIFDLRFWIEIAALPYKQVTICSQ